MTDRAQAVERLKRTLIGLFATAQASGTKPLAERVALRERLAEEVIALLSPQTPTAGEGDEKARRNAIWSALHRFATKSPAKPTEQNLPPVIPEGWRLVPADVFDGIEAAFREGYAEALGLSESEDRQDAAWLASDTKALVDDFLEDFAASPPSDPSPPEPDPATVERVVTAIHYARERAR